MAATMQAPNPAVLDAAPSVELAGSAVSAEPQEEDARGDFSLGPVSLRGTKLGPITFGTANTNLRFHARQKFRVNDKVEASLGAYYSFRDERIGPTASITYALDANTKVVLDERRALLRRKWAWARGNLGLGLAAECSILHAGLAPGAPRRPELHISLDHIKPVKYELLGIGLVLLGNLPFSLRDKEVEKASVARRLLGFARATVKRTGYTAARVDFSEVSGVLEL